MKTRSVSARLLLFVAVFVAVAPAARAQDPGGDAAKPEAREGGWMTLHESFVAQARKGGVDLVFLGDSITQGWGSRGDQGPTSVWDRYYDPRRAANFGIGGDRTQHVLWRVTHGELDGIRPKVVVLNVGTNNMYANTPAEIADAVGLIVKAVRKALPESKVLVLGIFPRGKEGESVRERIKAANARIARLDDGKAVRYLDLGPSFLGPDGALDRAVMPDLLHLSRRGYGIWAEAMEPTLQALLEGK